VRLLRRALDLFAILVLVSACSGAGTSSSLAPASGSSATPQATPDLDHPVGIIAMGHSGLTGEGTAGPFQANPSASWATGTEPAVNSVYLRLLAIVPAMEGRFANTAMGGAAASLLLAQTESALQAVQAPLLAIIQTVDNDIQCDGSNIDAVGKSLAAALAVISEASPNTRILVVGQAGRPSIAFIEELVAIDPSMKANLTWDDDCSFFDAGGRIREEGVAKLRSVIDAYEAETARICEAVPNCATDGGVRRAYVDDVSNFSPDYAHFNEQGQAAMAELIWPVVVDLLGL
jgi:hypothetical protein